MFSSHKTSLVAAVSSMALVLALGSAPARAQDDAVALPDVDIVARDARPAEPRPELDPQSATNPMRLARSNTGHSERITRQQIEELRPRDVFDLVNNASGVISTQGGRKGFSGLMIRGDSNFVWIIDGAYIQPTMAARIMRNLPVNIIEEVTVVRGSAALTLAPMVGSASPGGAPVDGFVVVRTRKPLGNEAEARVAAESFGGVQTSLWAGRTFSTPNGKGYVAGSGSFVNNDGRGDTLNNGATYNNFSRFYTGFGKAGFEADDWSVNLSAYRDHGNFGIPNANSHGPGQGSWYMDPSQTFMTTFNGMKRWTPQQVTLLNVSHIESRQSFWTANTAAGPYSMVRNPNKATHLNLRHNIDFDTWRVSLGGDFRHWDAPNGQQYYEGIRREENTYGGFAQVEKRFFDDKVSVDAAVRLDRVNILHGLDYYTGGAQPPGGVNSPLRTTNKMMPPAKFFELGSSVKISDEWKLTGRVGQGEQGTTGLNPRPGVTLAPDSQFKAELGLEAKGFRWFNPSFNLFHREVKNEKSLSGYTYVATNNSLQTCRTGVIPAAGPFSPKAAAALTPCYDQANTTRQGYELNVAGGLWDGASYKANFTQFVTLVNTGGITPRYMGGLSLEQRWGDYLFTGTAKYVAKYKGSRTDAGAYLGGYTRIDVGIGRDFKFDDKTLRATLYGRNLTDKRYETSNGIQDVGRVIGVELLAKF